MTRFALVYLVFSIPSVLCALLNKTKHIGETRCRPVSNQTLQHRYTQTLYGSGLGSANKPIPISTTCNIQNSDNSKAWVSRQVCKSRGICTFDANRFPPYLYQAACIDDLDDTHTFQCHNDTYAIWVLRRQPCVGKKQKMERWVWAQQTVQIGCNIRNAKENAIGAVQNVMKAVQENCKRQHG